MSVEVKQLIYVLDRDYVPKESHKNTIDGSTGINNFEVKFFNKRGALKFAISEKKPELVLFDLYSKRKKPKRGLNDDEFNEINSIISNQGYLQQEEKSLDLLQSSKELCRNILDITHHTSGIKDIIWLKNRSKIKVNFAFGLFSRHGKSLLTSEELMDIFSLGALLAWKEKETQSGDNTFSDRELESFELIIDVYNKRQEILPKKLKALNNEVEQKERMQNFLYKAHDKFEVVFCIFIVLSSLSQMGGVLADDVVKSSLSLFNILFPKLFPILAILAVILYLISKYCLNITGKKLISLYCEINDLIQDLTLSKR